MNTGTRILAIVIAVLVLAGGIFLSSFSSPYREPVEADPPLPAIAPPEATTYIASFEIVEDTPEPVNVPLPTSEPEAEATPEPEPETTPEPTPEVIPAGFPPRQLDSSFFDDAAFLGDSISGTLEYYRMNRDGLGKAEFFVTVDYSVQAAVDNSLFVIFRDRYMKPQDALKAAGVSKVYIMLGAMGDLGNYGIDKTMENWGTLIANIREVNPDIRIFIQSCTPIVADTQKLSNRMIDEYNARLKDFAAENDCTYVEIGEHFKNSNGQLDYKYCRDGFAHLRIDAADLWVEQLKDSSNYSVSPFES